MNVVLNNKYKNIIIEVLFCINDTDTDTAQDLF